MKNLINKSDMVSEEAEIYERVQELLEPIAIKYTVKSVPSKLNYIIELEECPRWTFAVEYDKEDDTITLIAQPYEYRESLKLNERPYWAYKPEKMIEMIEFIRNNAKIALLYDVYEGDVEAINESIKDNDVDSEAELAEIKYEEWIERFKIMSDDFDECFAMTRAVNKTISDKLHYSCDIYMQDFKLDGLEMYLYVYIKEHALPKIDEICEQLRDIASYYESESECEYSTLTIEVMTEDNEHSYMTIEI